MKLKEGRIWVFALSVAACSSPVYHTLGDGLSDAGDDALAVGSGGAAVADASEGGAASTGGDVGAAGSGALCKVGDTRLCVGPGACRGGQACLADRSGFGPCTCGSAGAGGAGSGGFPSAGGGPATGGFAPSSGGQVGTGAAMATGGSGGGGGTTCAPLPQPVSCGNGLGVCDRPCSVSDPDILATLQSIDDPAGKCQEVTLVCVPIVEAVPCTMTSAAALLATMANSAGQLAGCVPTYVVPTGQQGLLLQDGCPTNNLCAPCYNPLSSPSNARTGACPP